MTELDSSDPSTNEATLRILLEALATNEKTLEKGRLGADVANWLGRAIETLPADQQGRVANSVVDALARQTDPNSRWALINGLARLAKALPPERAAILLADALAKETNLSARQFLAGCLVELAKAVPPERARNLLESPARTLADALAKQTDPTVPGLGQRPGEAGEGPAARTGANLLDTPTRTLADALTKQTAPSARRDLAGGLADMAKALPAERAAILLESPTRTLADALAEQTKPSDRWYLADGLAALAKALPDERTANLLVVHSPRRLTRPHNGIWLEAWRSWRRPCRPSRAAILLESPTRTLADALVKGPTRTHAGSLPTAWRGWRRPCRPSGPRTCSPTALAKETDQPCVWPRPMAWRSW